MTLLAAIALIASALAPFITAVFTHPELSPARKRLIAGCVAFVLGVVVAIATGQISGVPQGFVDWLGWALISIGVVISVSQGFYHAWKDAVDNVAAKTSGVGYAEDI